MCLVIQNIILRFALLSCIFNNRVKIAVQFCIGCTLFLFPVITLCLFLCLCFHRLECSKYQQYLSEESPQTADTLVPADQPLDMGKEVLDLFTAIKVKVHWVLKMVA